MTETLLDERVITEREVTTSNDKPDAAHVVRKPDSEPDESNHAYVMRARIEGFPITALCGYTWVPSREASSLPVCQECKDIWDNLPDTGQGWVRE